jgi:hypothetical protein
MVYKSANIKLQLARLVQILLVYSREFKNRTIKKNLFSCIQELTEKAQAVNCLIQTPGMQCLEPIPLKKQVSIYHMIKSACI